MGLVIFSHLMTPRMSLSLPCVLVLLLLCLSHQCSGRYLCTIDNAKILSHSTLKGFENNSFAVHDDLLDLKNTAHGKGQTSKANNDSQKQKDHGSKKEKVSKFREHDHRHRQRLHHDHHPKSITFRVPPKDRRVHQQPGFALDYSPPKTHPPSHN